ncbi:hypothetical protein Bhyg_03562 [Pseudolycoriella hygida]|uniref:Uncharacterized protein n=1 Tax=Pseudolycoriella hygida TaxID=35572 RepID=A0A9Q0NF68_9DIPT|nr:hypothetical protein Bhyg_03562 [Pseudolycoriella hygida]
MNYTMITQASFMNCVMPLALTNYRDTIPMRENIPAREEVSANSLPQDKVLVWFIDDSG